MRYNARRAGRYSSECSVRKSGGRQRPGSEKTALSRSCGITAHRRRIIGLPATNSRGLSPGPRDARLSESSPPATPLPTNRSPSVRPTSASWAPQATSKKKQKPAGDTLFDNCGAIGALDGAIHLQLVRRAERSGRQLQRRRQVLRCKHSGQEDLFYPLLLCQADFARYRLSQEPAKTGIASLICRCTNATLVRRCPPRGAGFARYPVLLGYRFLFCPSPNRYFAASIVY